MYVEESSALGFKNERSAERCDFIQVLLAVYFKLFLFNRKKSTENRALSSFNVIQKFLF